MKAISGNLLSLLTEHNQTGTVIWKEGCSAGKKYFLLFFPRIFRKLPNSNIKYRYKVYLKNQNSWNLIENEITLA